MYESMLMVVSKVKYKNRLNLSLLIELSVAFKSAQDQILPYRVILTKVNINKINFM